MSGIYKLCDQDMMGVTGEVLSTRVHDFAIRLGKVVDCGRDSSRPQSAAFRSRIREMFY